MNRLIKIILFITLFRLHDLYASDPGLRAFNNKEYEKALNYYLKKLDKDQINPMLNYNAGTAAMKSGRPDLAVPHFEKSMRNAEKKEILAKNSYNLGHLLAENNEYEQALNAFMQAILLNPEDVNSKIMYEIIKSQMQEQEEQDQEQDGDQDQEQDGDQDQEQDGDQDQEQDGDQEQKQESEPQDSQVTEDSPAESQKDEESRDPEQDLTEQQIVNLLDAMRDREKEAMKEILRYRYQNYKIQREKDW